MSIIEKIFLAAALVFSFLLGMLVNYFFDNITDSGLVLLFSVIGISVWLVSLVLLVLFSTKPAFSILAVGIGLLSFLIVESNPYIFLGLMLVVIGFVSWFFHVGYAKKNSTGFSVIHSLKGWNSFLALVAIFGGLLSFYSPFATEMLVKPQIPQKLFDSVYDSLSDLILGQVNQQLGNSSLIPPGLSEKQPNPGSFLDNNGLKVPDNFNNQLANQIPQSALKELNSNAPKVADKEEIRKEFYKGLNGSVNDLAQKYQAYIPFAFAASTFLLLQLIFIPVKYLVIALTSGLVKLFIKAGWLKKETVQITVERVKA